jgi:ABC-type antimicrobial peptide transport system permease subunit
MISRRLDHDWAASSWCRGALLDIQVDTMAMLRIVAAVLALLTLSVVMLSAAGIYALMSCTVEQRRKEIGIRAALGADPRRIVGAIFARALAQLATGAALGVAIAAALEGLSRGDLMAGNGAVILPVVSLFMMTVGLVAAWGPSRRGLRIHPTETLREE